MATTRYPFHRWIQSPNAAGTEVLAFGGWWDASTSSGTTVEADPVAADPDVPAPDIDLAPDAGAITGDPDVPAGDIDLTIDGTPVAGTPATPAGDVDLAPDAAPVAGSPAVPDLTIGGAVDVDPVTGDPDVPAADVDLVPGGGTVGGDPDAPSGDVGLAPSVQPVAGAPAVPTVKVFNRKLNILDNFTDTDGTAAEDHLADTGQGLRPWFTSDLNSGIISNNGLIVRVNNTPARYLYTTDYTDQQLQTIAEWTILSGTGTLFGILTRATHNTAARYSVFYQASGEISVVERDASDVPISPDVSLSLTPATQSVRFRIVNANPDSPEVYVSIDGGAETFVDLRNVTLPVGKVGFFEFGSQTHVRLNYFTAGPYLELGPVAAAPAVPDLTVRLGDLSVDDSRIWLARGRNTVFTAERNTVFTSRSRNTIWVP